MKPRTCIIIGAVTLTTLSAATAGHAQSREGRWELNLVAIYQLGTGVDADNGSTLDTDDSLGFEIGGAYNISDRLAAGFGLQWAGIDYDATATDPDTGAPVGISGSYDQFVLSGNLVLNLTDGPIVPYVGAGIGWMF